MLLWCCVIIGPVMLHLASQAPPCNLALIASSVIHLQVQSFIELLIRFDVVMEAVGGMQSVLY